MSESFRNFETYKDLTMSTKLHTKNYSNSDQLFILFNPVEEIPQGDTARLVDAIVEALPLKGFKKLYRERGRCAYHPKMMLKIILFAYMNNTYSCRKIEELLRYDIRFKWLAAQECPDFITINRFRNRVKNEIGNIFTLIVLKLAEKGFISLDVEYVDGTKVESKANKYTFVWRKSVEKNREKLQEKLRILLQQIDEVIVQEKAAEGGKADITTEELTTFIEELKASIPAELETKDEEQKKARREKEKQIKELEKRRDKLAEYDNQLKQIGDRNSMSKTDPDATFMHMKEDAMNNGQTKPGYNLQISTENQFITDFALFPNRNDTLTLIPFLNSFHDKYGHYVQTVVADSGYGSEENYRFMAEAGTEAYVKYNRFHIDLRQRKHPDPFRPENWPYNAEKDYLVCPMGQHMTRIGTATTQTASGYTSEIVQYQAQNCKGCPLRGQCYKAQSDRRTIEVNHRLNAYKRQARERLTSEEGVKHRGQRCIEPEAVFGQMKYDVAYRRFRHFGKDKVTMDFAFFAIAFNIKKMCATMARRGKNGKNAPQNALFCLYIALTDDENRFLGNLRLKTAA